MAILSASIYHGSPGATPVTIYAAPTTGSVTVQVAAVSNDTGVTQTWALSIVRGGVAHRIVHGSSPNASLAGFDSVQLDVRQVLVGGDVLTAAVSDPGVVLRISGVTQGV